MSRKKTTEEKALHASYGACNAEWVEASDEGRVVLMFSTFISLVIRDGISPQDAHDAFLTIDLYRENVSPSGSSRTIRRRRNATGGPFPCMPI